MISFRFSPIALGLALFIYSFAAVFGASVGSWIVPLALLVIHDGLAGVSQAQRTDYLFGALPPWLSPGSGVTVAAQTLNWIAVLGLMIACLVAAQRAWHYLAVVKWKLMTQEEFEEFERRAGDD